MDFEIKSITVKLNQFYVNQKHKIVSESHEPWNVVSLEDYEETRTETGLQHELMD